jgi:hypothetical protein
VQNEGNVLIGDRLQRDQRLGGLQLVVEWHEFEFLAQCAALCIHLVQDVPKGL